MFEECVGAMAVVGSGPGQSLNEQVLAERKDAEVVAGQKDQAIGERTGPGPGEKLVGMRSGLENEARSRTILGTEGRMTGPCEDLGGSKVQATGSSSVVIRSPGHKGSRATTIGLSKQGSDDQNLFTSSRRAACLIGQKVVRVAIDSRANLLGGGVEVDACSLQTTANI